MFRVACTRETLQEASRAKEEDGEDCREKERRAIEMERARRRKEEKESERGTGRFTQTLVKLRPSLTSGYIARVNELAPADDQGL